MNYSFSAWNIAPQWARQFLGIVTISALVLMSGGPLFAVAAPPPPPPPASITIDTINGDPLPAHCVAGEVTVVVHGVSGNNGGPYSIDVGNGFSTTTVSDAVTGHSTAFSDVSITYTPTEAGTNLYVFLYHGTPSGNDSHFQVVNQCIAPPTQGVVTVIKTVSGGTAVVSDFSLHVKQGSIDVSGSPAAGSTFGSDYLLNPNTYTVSEDSNPNYTPSFSGNCNSSGSVTVVAGNNYTCTVTNTFNPPTTGTLHVVKHVVKNNGGTASAADWSLHVKDGSNAEVSGSPQAGSETGTDYTFAGGAYVVSETGGPEGYTPTFSGDCDVNGNVTVVNGQSKTCTITNDDIAPQLSVTKSVTSDNGGTKTSPSDFTFLVDLQEVLSGVLNPFFPDTYQISEQDNAGYSFVFGGDCNESGSVTLELGDVKDCTITNDDQKPTLVLNKVVVDNSDNDVTGPISPSAWTLTATGATGFSGFGPSVSSDTAVDSFDAGTYDLSESGPGGYAASDWVCTGGSQLDGDTVVVGLGESVSCTITNDDIPLPLCSNKVDDDSDGLADAADPGCWTDPNNSETYDANDQSENNETTLATCSDGQDNDGDESVDLLDEDCSAYIPKLVIHKIVVNDNFGGTAGPGDFSFDATAGADSFFDVFFEVVNLTTGEKTVPLNTSASYPASYSVTEDAYTGYSSTPSGDCSGTITIGETKHCTFTNEDQQTTLVVEKVLTKDSGKSGENSDFSFTVNGGDSYVFEADGSNTLVVTPGSYTVVENDAPGFDVSYSGQCTEVELALGGTATCTITNDDLPACSDNLDNDGDGDVDAEDPGCYVDGGDGPVYDPEGQTEGNESTEPLCTDGVDNDDDQLVDLDDPDCSAFAPKIIVQKVINTGEAEVDISFSDFSFSVNGGSAQNFENDGSNEVTVGYGTHTVVENLLQDWDLSNVSCVYDEESVGESVQNGKEVTVGAGDTVTCTFTNVYNPVSTDVCSNIEGIQTEAPSGQQAEGNGECHNIPGGGGGGGGGGNGPLILGGGGLVLGASTGQVLGVSCGLSMNQHLRKGSGKNRADQVSKLQSILNKWVKANLPVTGVFGPLTEAAVHAFQSTYSNATLKPWNLSASTGIVYLTTLRQINLLECPELSIQLPALIPWSQNPAAQ